MTRTIRSHNKSRKGCLHCKIRRIKCDEVKPRCSACTRRSDECIYVSPPMNRRFNSLTASSTKTAPVESRDLATAISYELPRVVGSTGKDLLPLRLMHHYDTATVNSFAGPFQLQGRLLKGLQVDVPLLAFEHPFLLNTVLLVAMIHIASTSPCSVSMVDLTMHRDQVICALRKELAAVSDNNLRAIRMSSLLLAATSLAADRVTGHSGIWLTNFLAMTIGSRAFMERHRAGHHSRNDTKPTELAVTMGKSLHPAIPSSMPLSLEKVLRVEQDDADWEYLDELYQAASGIAKLFDSLARPHTRLSIVFQLKAWPFFCVSDRFVHLARQERPRALVIMAYYLAFLRYFPATWLYDDVARGDMEKIVNILGPEWHEFLSIPMTAVLLDEESLTDFLLDQVPPESRAEPASTSPWKDSA
ncbi:fungal Zn binuclear cluster domain-containing protein [Thelonectria olida]|uniref:Fungal Zn binuclear cluster domain-containing protein n=1 Tax=Thelonectria olida TaxID=1576542 RepID=A0A9P8VXK2_9HYPO|nr:fungal Zn binuclear cluster domain-containing protein [Thelonectria olida]